MTEHHQLLSGERAMAQSTAALSWGQVLVIALIVGLSVLGAGVIVAVTRSKDPETPRGSLIRSWMAISLVMGLLLFCGFSMALADSTLRSTLIGALAASAGTAIAYYFSSKASEEARKDIMNAAFGTMKVPDLAD